MLGPRVAFQAVSFCGFDPFVAHVGVVHLGGAVLTARRPVARWVAAACWSVVGKADFPAVGTHCGRSAVLVFVLLSAEA